MRVLPALSLLAAAALSLSVEAGSVTRALAANDTTASSGDTAAAAEELKKYLGNDAANMTEAQFKDKLEELNEQAESDSKLADILHKLKLDTQSLAEDTKDWLAKVSDGVKTLFFGKDDNNDDNFDGVFGTVWKSLFGKKKSSSAGSSTHGSGSGSVDEDVGSSGSSSGSAVIKQPTSSSGSQDDTSIETVAPASTPTPSKTVAKTNSGAKLLTSLPLAGTLAAIFVINFVQ